MAKSIFAKQPDGAIQLTITIPVDEVNKGYERAIVDIVNNAEIDGFRKGKAPRKIVEEKTDKSKVYEKVLQDIVPQAYIEAVKEHSLKPIIAPKVELLKAKEGEDWEIRATTCEEPAIDLGDYKEKVKTALASGKLWTPDQKEPGKEKTPQETEDEKTQKVIQAILDNVKIEIPQIIIEEEVNRSVASLINQTNSMGLTIDQYLTSIGKTPQLIREEYSKKTVANYKMQFALDKIAGEEKIEVTEQEIEDLVKATGDENLKKELENPMQKSYIKGLIARRKTLEFLTKL
jgi:FKBP-type peptidyl-prolyl cis-trans isomerase (trigger factor)